MKELLDKLKEILKDIEKEDGLVVLFALFLREGALGMWDLLVAAPWLDASALASYDHIAKRIQGRLTPDQVVKLDRIVLLDPKDSAVSFLQDNYPVPNGSFIEIPNCEPLTDRYGFTIQRAYVLRCIREPMQCKE
ncbi:MAG TPA: hypothetical protein VLE95_09075 [Chlamydiales bacterium]|nr:hypothetical protein [Chlamydiales bacterium]